MKLSFHASNEYTLSRVKVVKPRTGLYHFVSCCVFLKNNVVADKLYTCRRLVQSAPWYCFCSAYFEIRKVYWEESVLGEKTRESWERVRGWKADSDTSFMCTF